MYVCKADPVRKEVGPDEIHHCHMPLVSPFLRCVYTSDGSKDNLSKMRLGLRPSVYHLGTHSLFCHPIVGAGINFRVPLTYILSNKLMFLSAGSNGRSRFTCQHLGLSTGCFLWEKRECLHDPVGHLSLRAHLLHRRGGGALPQPHSSPVPAQAKHFTHCLAHCECLVTVRRHPFS